MISLFPYHQLTIQTRLPLKEAKARLERLVLPKRSFSDRFWGRGSGFEGVVTQNGFTLVRQINYRNSFRPTLYGRFEDTPTGTRVRVRMVMHPLVIVFCIFWAGGVGTGAFHALASWTRAGETGPAGLVPIGMLVFFYVLTTGGFAVEASKGVRFLREVYGSA